MIIDVEGTISEAIMIIEIDVVVTVMMGEAIASVRGVRMEMRGAQHMIDGMIGVKRTIVAEGIMGEADTRKKKDAAESERNTRMRDLKGGEMINVSKIIAIVKKIGEFETDMKKGAEEKIHEVETDMRKKTDAAESGRKRLTRDLKGGEMISGSKMIAPEEKKDEDEIDAMKGTGVVRSVRTTGLTVVA